MSETQKHYSTTTGADIDPWKRITALTEENAALRRALQELHTAIPKHLLVAHMAVPMDPVTGFQVGEPSTQTFPRLQKAAAEARACLAAISQTEG